MKLTETVYESLQASKGYPSTVSIEDIVREGCEYKNYLRFVQEVPGKEEPGNKILRREVCKAYRNKVKKYLSECYGKDFTPGGVGSLHDIIEVDVIGFIGDCLIEVLPISLGAFDGSAAKGTVPAWAQAVVATKAHLTKKKKALLILVNRNNQSWCSFSISGQVGEVAKEVLDDVKVLDKLLKGTGAHVGDESSCSRCQYQRTCMADRKPAKAPYDVSYLAVSESADLCSQLDQYLWALNKKKSSRSTNCIHPSEFSISQCDRRIAYGLVGVERKDSISASLRRIFDFGHACHDVLQDTMVSALNGRCDIEVPVRHEALKIRGSCDGVLDQVHGQEIKSISCKGFVKLASPKKEHQKQGTLYGVPLNLEDVTYLYINKDTGDLQEYTIPVSKSLWHRMAAQAESILRDVEKDVLPDRITKDYLCKACPYCWKCRPELRRA